MNQWTDSAKTRLERYFAKVREDLAGSGADVTEVTEDLRRHIEEELAARRLVVVTEADLEQVLARVGSPEAAVAVGEPEQAFQRPGQAIELERPSGWLLVIGVFIPFGTIVFEYLSGACAGILFDPWPTVAHVALTAFVPLANLVIWQALARRRLEWRTRLGWANGIAIGIALVYVLLFLPVTPFAIIGVVYLVGLLALAPLFSLIAALSLRSRLRRASGADAPLPGLWRGLGIGSGLVCLFTLPIILTNVGLQRAVSDSPEENKAGVRLLRTWGQEEELLRASYGRSGRGGELYSWGRRVGPEEARAVYYRVYGRAFNAVPPPKLYSGRARWDLVEQEFTWDNDQGGDAVAGRVRGLTLVNSRQDGFIEPGASLGYLEWTLEFKNDSPLQREARAQILLPPGGVVSRLTLWVDGEEREAAFGGRTEVKTAYKRVVQRRRDPVLVTTCGPDRVLVQCFPVPPGGGKMKARLGITAPLALNSAEAGYLRWPSFVERNFTIPEGFQHSLWMESSQPMETFAGKVKSEAGKPGKFVLRGQMRDTALGAPVNVLRASRPPQMNEAWTSQTREADGQIICQKLVAKPSTPPDRVILVVDGTQGMEPYLKALSASLSKLPPEIDFAVVLARDGYQEIVPIQRGNADLYRRVALWKFGGKGGHDNVPALVYAWELAAQAKAGTIVWVHGPQPMLLASMEELKQRFERSSNPPLLLDVQAHEGPNRLLEALDGIKSVRSLMRVGELGDDLGRLFNGWSSGTPLLEMKRERLPASATPNNTQEQASMHLARLWAADENGRLRQSRRLTEAAEMATRYQLVTPVSGAVVLETKAQFQEAGLQPVAPDSVPVVPEPSAGLLFLVGLALLGRRFLRKHAGRREVIS